MKITGAVLYKENTPLKLEELEMDAPAAGEVLVKLKSSGVCHSDWHMIKGDWDTSSFPMILGHEGAGVVEEVGHEVRTIKKGDHVILSWKQSCGYCEVCEQGLPQLCGNIILPSSKPRLKGVEQGVNRFINLGTFATYTVVPEIAAIPIDKDIAFPQAALLGCGVMTGVGAAINTAKVAAGSTVAVFGSGGVGLSCIQGAVICGASQIIAVDLSDYKLELAMEFGATHTVNASHQDPVKAIKDLTGGLGVHYAFEAIGLVPEPFVQSIHCTRKHGMTVWVGHAPLDTQISFSPRDIIAEKTITSSMYGSARPHIDFPRLLNLYKAGKLKLDEMISRSYPLEQVNDSIEILAQNAVARSVLVMD